MTTTTSTQRLFNIKDTLYHFTDSFSDLIEFAKNSLIIVIIEPTDIYFSDELTQKPLQQPKHIKHQQIAPVKTRKVIKDTSTFWDSKKKCLFYY